MRIETKTDLKTEGFSNFESSCFHHRATKLTRNCVWLGIRVSISLFRPLQLVNTTVKY